MTLTIKDLAYQATAYERGGYIDFDAFKKGMILEELEEINCDEIISMYRDYLINDDRYDDEIYENDEYFFETFFANNPMEAVRATHYSNHYNFMEPYVRFNGYGNLETLGEYEVEKEAKGDNYFIGYLYENHKDFSKYDNLYELIEFLKDNEEEIIEEAIKLINEGY